MRSGALPNLPYLTCTRPWRKCSSCCRRTHLASFAGVQASVASRNALSVSCLIAAVTRGGHGVGQVYLPCLMCSDSFDIDLSKLILLFSTCPVPVLGLHSPSMYVTSAFQSRLRVSSAQSAENLRSANANVSQELLVWQNVHVSEAAWQMQVDSVCRVRANVDSHWLTNPHTSPTHIQT